MTAMTNAARFVVAVKRDCRDTAPDDWLETVRATPGVTVVGDNPARAQIEATPEALERIVAALGDYLHVEPVILHKRSM